MATEPNAPTLSTEPEAPVQAAIENEFATYRAISPSAVFSMILGLVSIFCYADLWFLTVAIGAIVVGLLARRRINRYPEILTGTGLTTVGIALGLVFGLSSVTRLVVQNVTVQIKAGQFARQYVEVIKNDSVARAIWYQQNPAFRAENDPEKVIGQLKSARPTPVGNPYLDRIRPIQDMKARLKEPGGDVKYSRIESSYLEGLKTTAFALLEVTPAQDSPTKEPEYALLELVNDTQIKPDSVGPWYIRDLRFPYKPASAVAGPERKADDGHGH